MTPDLRPDDLVTELRRRRELDQAVRADVRRGTKAATDITDVDAANTSWLKDVVAAVGWPGHSLVGDEGAHIAWMLVQHADRDRAFQRRCLELLKRAVAEGEASPCDLAYLTDRVLLAYDEPQIYGTQLTAQNGRLVPCRLLDPGTVDERRAGMGLETLDAYLRGALETLGPPSPTCITCTRCNERVELWLPEPGEMTEVSCRACGRRITVRAYRPDASLPGTSSYDDGRRSPAGRSGRSAVGEDPTPVGALRLAGELR
jgi:DNA-directed RNA polymerase subunit RPC12/RpoP